MHCDHYSKIGSRHKICQDYTLTGEQGDSIFAVLCDGCSSAPDTDLGARLVAHQIKQKLPRYWGSDYSLATQVGNACNDLSMALGISREANFATAGYIYSNRQIVKIGVFGDGVVYIKDQNDKENIFWVHFIDNTPYYPYYVHDNSINTAYHAGRHGKYTVVSITPSSQECIAEEYISQSNPTTFMGVYPASSIKVAAVLSDGIDSFKDTDGPIPIIDALNYFTEFKNYAGEFVYRRCQNAFKELEGYGCTWGDDFSMIALENVL